MNKRAISVSVCVSVVLAISTLVAQPGARHLDMKARVLDLLFPLNAASAPYFLKMVLRYGDSDTQLVVVAHPGRKCEMISYSLAGIGRGELSRVIARIIAENPEVTEQDIAAKLKVVVNRKPVEYSAMDRLLKKLSIVRISPVLVNRVSVDEVSEYEYWYDTWQESVHYTINGPFKDTPQDELVQWMIRFRDKFQGIVSTPPLSK